MKAISWLAGVSIAAISSVAFAEDLTGWSSDLDKSLKLAKAENKSLLVEFTGSDWCPPCIAMRKNVFSKKEFVEAASKNYILVEVDMPQGNEALAKKNAPLVEKYKIEGYPTVILMKPDGTEFTRFFASQHPTLEAFLKHIEDARKPQAPAESPVKK